MRASKLLRVLRRSPSSYEVERQNGSHRRLVSEDYPAVIFAFHDSVTIAPGLVRKVLCKVVGLTQKEALKLR